MIIKELNTKRIKFREIEQKDLKHLHRLLTDKDVNKYIPLPKMTIEKTSDLLSSIIKDKNLIERERFFFILEDLNNGNVIGSIVLKRTDKNNTAILGYSFFKDFWGKGYASEAAIAMVEYGFNSIKLNRIESSCIPLNPASEKVLLKCKMKHKTTKEKSLLINNTWYDERYYYIERE